MMMIKPKIEVLSTGDEVLYGQITDTNAAWLSNYLFEQGYLVTSRLTIGDNLQQLTESLQQRSRQNDVLIVNGGLGPTSDDLTAQAAAQACGEKLILFPQWLAEMENYFAQRNQAMPSSNIKQAMLPQSAIILDNPIGTACGFRMMINQCVIYFTPGVPSEFKRMVSEQIVPDLQKQFPVKYRPLCYRLTIMGRSESDLANKIETKLTVPAGISIGYRSAMPKIEIKLTADQYLQSTMDKLWRELKELVKDNLLYEGTTGLASLVSQLLMQHQQTLIIIEQFTAGLIAYALYHAHAPIVHSEVLSSDQDVNSTLAQLRQRYPQAIILALHDVDQRSGQFKLQLLTPKHNHIYQLRYQGRRYSIDIEQAIFSAVGHDTLRRYLLGLPLIGNNYWLEVINE